MFCPQCATENAKTLKYCTRCGTNLEVVMQSIATHPGSTRPAESLIGPEHVKFILWVIILVAVGGIGGVTGMVVSLAREGIGEPVLPLLGMFGYGAVVGMIAILSRLLSRKASGSRAPEAPSRAERAPMTSPAYLPPASSSSVTEQNTSRMPVEEKRTRG